MKIKMAQPDLVEVSSDEPELPSQEIVPVETRSPAVFINTEDAEGEFSQDDRLRSYLSIVAKTGKMADIFTPGDIVVNQEFVIGGTKSPIEFVPIRIVKRYQNDVRFDPEEPADIVNSAVEVVQRGGVVGYRPFNDKESTHYWKPILQCLLLVKRPDNVPADVVMLFPFDIGGVSYGVMGYTARTKTAYNGFAKPLIEVKIGRGTVRDFNYRLTTKSESWHDPKTGEDKSWIAVLARSVGPVTEEMAKFLRDNYA